MTGGRAGQLARIGRQNVPGTDFARDQEHLRAVRELAHRRRPALLGKSRLTLEDYKTRVSEHRNPTPPHRSEGLDKWAAAVLAHQVGANDEPWAIRRGRLGRWLQLQARVMARTAETPPETLRQRAWALRDVLRAAHPSPRCAQCYYARIGSIGLVRNDQGRHAVTGAAVCGSVWGCPACALRIKGTRAEEIKEAVELLRQHHGTRSLVMATLTLSHHEGDELRAMREGFTRAFDRLLNTVPEDLKAVNRARRRQGLPAINWKERAGFLGHVAGAEVTTGQNGWHYHRHAILAFDREADCAELDRILAAHWRDCVVAELGEKHAPSLERGATFTPLHLEKYIAKLGLEISDVGSKQARGGSRSIWALAESAATGHGPDLEKWSEFVAAMKGAKAVQWGDKLLSKLRSFGFRPLASDEDIMSDETKGALVDEWTPAAWVTTRESGATLAILECADRGEYTPQRTSRGEWGDGARVEAERDKTFDRAERQAIRDADGVPPRTRGDRRAEQLAALRATFEASRELPPITPAAIAKAYEQRFLEACLAGE